MLATDRSCDSSDCVNIFRSKTLSACDCSYDNSECLRQNIKIKDSTFVQACLFFKMARKVCNMNKDIILKVIDLIFMNKQTTITNIDHINHFLSFMKYNYVILHHFYIYFGIIRFFILF